MKTLFLPVSLRPVFQTELMAARAAHRRHDHAGAFRHLERAHVLGQCWAVSHTQVHVLMLGHGLRTRNLREIMGQLPRIVLGFLGSFVGRVPVGNTGGANVPAEQPMPIPPDLQALLAAANPTGAQS